MCRWLNQTKNTSVCNGRFDVGLSVKITMLKDYTRYRNREVIPEIEIEIKP